MTTLILREQMYESAIVHYQKGYGIAGEYVVHFRKGVVSRGYEILKKIKSGTWNSSPAWNLAASILPSIALTLSLIMAILIAILVNTMV